MKLGLIISDDGSLWLQRPGRAALTPVCTISQASRRLRRSRRQIHRQLGSGLLEDCGKVLGERLVGSESVERAARRPPATQPLPSILRGLFPEYALRDINAGTHRELVLSRILENGSLECIRWMRGRYRRAEIASFLEQDGPRLLSPRSLRFWRLFHGLPAEANQRKAASSWRARSNPWANR